MFKSNLIKECKASNICFVQKPESSGAHVYICPRLLRSRCLPSLVKAVNLCPSGGGGGVVGQYHKTTPSFLILILIWRHFLVGFPCQTYLNKKCRGTAYSRNYSFYPVGGFILGKWTAEGGMHFEKNKSVVCERFLFVTTQTSSSWREGVRELNSKMSLLMLQSRDFLHQAPWPWRGEGNICLS